jgi:hypothetical protein
MRRDDYRIGTHEPRDAIFGQERHAGPAAYPGGLWLWKVLVPSGLRAVVVPSGCRATFQPHWWMATWWWKKQYSAHPSTLVFPPSARWVTWCTSQARNEASPPGPDTRSTAWLLWPGSPRFSREDGELDPGSELPDQLRQLCAVLTGHRPAGSLPQPHLPGYPILSFL